MKAGDLDAWVKRYVAAWDSNNADDIGALFTDDAEYFTAPFRPSWRGRNGIVKGWLERMDEPGDHEFRHEVTAVADDLGIVRGWTRYPAQDQDEKGRLKKPVNHVPILAPGVICFGSG